MSQKQSFFKRFGTDIAGYTCLILVPFVGWLPGPGGIPLLITGLGLLSIHNTWAKRLLDYVKTKSESLRDVLFPNTKSIQVSWDLFAILVFISSFILSALFESYLVRGLAIIMATASTTIFFFNRNRIDRIQKKFKKR